MSKQVEFMSVKHAFENGSREEWLSCGHWKFASIRRNSDKRFCKECA